MLVIGIPALFRMRGPFSFNSRFKTKSHTYTHACTSNERCTNMFTFVHATRVLDHISNFQLKIKSMCLCSSGRCWCNRWARFQAHSASGSKCYPAGSAPSSSLHRNSSSLSRSKKFTLEPVTTARRGPRWLVKALVTRPSGSARLTSRS